MNRLVIIGNGFDLAHGLPTSYKDFIDDYWLSVCDSKVEKIINHADDFVTVICKFGDLSTVIEDEVNDNLKCYEDLKMFVGKYKSYRHDDFVIEFKNSFFEVISEKQSIQNWVDIENEYYSKLKVIAKLGSLTLKSKKEQVLLLNKEFEQVKRILEKYLNNRIIESGNKITFISDLFKVNKGTESYFLEFPYEDSKELEKDYIDFNSEKVKEIVTCFLNFNYTGTIDRYINLAKEYKNERVFGVVENVQIHGRLNDVGNKVNFGFGDEMDEDYKLIENIDDNEYLKNFKSFQYSQNSNYRKLLSFVESGSFQVFIMGHSCGLSDRTLLNTVFEHKNCRSIKPFYYQNKNDKGEIIKDNYTEIVQNISRHFNDKKLMREKIVNKTLCQPLPQIQLPLK
jgi:hypothetical protein